MLTAPRIVPRPDTISPAADLLVIRRAQRRQQRGASRRAARCLGLVGVGNDDTAGPWVFHRE